MKKQSNKFNVIVTESVEKLKTVVDNDPLCDFEFLELLKKSNENHQEYHWITGEDKYALVIIYNMKMNVLTYGKSEFYMNLRVVGLPCSLSEKGYVTNDEKMVYEYVSSLKGPKLFLNVPDKLDIKNMTIGETLPTCVFENNFNSIEEYMNSLRSGYRRRINLAIKNSLNIDVKSFKNECPYDIYSLYLNTFNKSNYKLEKLEKNFFESVDAEKLVFVDRKSNKARGFVLLKKYSDKLCFMFCGMDYEYDTADLYYFMLYSIIKYAIENECKVVDFGQTSEDTKLRFGAHLEKRYFYAHHSNVILNTFAKCLKGLLEYNYNFKKYNVYKDV